VSWPYQKCHGVRADGERCQGRAGRGGLYCHRHDPARKTSTAPTPEVVQYLQNATTPAARRRAEATRRPEAPAEDMTCERCDEPAFPGRGFCADHLLESLGLEYDDPGAMERGMNRQCVARRDGVRCRDRFTDRSTKLCAHHQKLLDGGVDFEDVLRGDVDPPEDRKNDGRRRSDSKLSPARRVEAELAKEGSGNGAEPVVADVDMSEEEHERVTATVGDILRDARSSSREAIEETVALLLDARRTAKVVAPPDAKPGQTIDVQVPDLKLRLDGLKFISERLEGRPAETKPGTGPQMAMPRTLADFEAMTFMQQFAFFATSELPAIKRLLEDGNPDDWEALRRNELRVGSLRWVVGELDKMERRAATA
jgi:hypothetical protein